MLKNKTGLLLLSGALLATGLSAKEFTMLAYAEKGSAEHKLVLEKIKKFEELHGGKHTIKLDIASNKAYHTKLQILSVAKKLPDVMNIWAGNRTNYVTDKGLIADLRPFLSDDVKGKFISQALVPQTATGEIYQIPQNLTLTGVVFANQALLKKLNLTYPKTHKEWLEQIPTIQKAGLTAVSIGNKAPWVMQSITLSAILGKTAGDAWLEKVVKGEAKFTDKQFVSALEALQEMYKKGLLDRATPNWDYNQGTNEFLRSKAVYSMNGGWIINNYMKNAPKGFLTNITMHAMPKMENEVNEGSISGVLGNGLGLNNNLSAEDKKVLFDLVKINAGLGVEKSAIKAGFIPLIKDLEFGDDVHALIKDLKTLTENSKVTYVFDGVVDPETTGLLQNLIQEMFLGSKTPAQVASEVEAFAAKNSAARK